MQQGRSSPSDRQLAWRLLQVRGTVGACHRHRQFQRHSSIAVGLKPFTKAPAGCLTAWAAHATLKTLLSKLIVNLPLLGIREHLRQGVGVRAPGQPQVVGSCKPPGRLRRPPCCRPQRQQSGEALPTGGSGKEAAAANAAAEARRCQQRQEQQQQRKPEQVSFLRTSKASDTSLNFFSAASLESGFLSGWYCIASFLHRVSRHQNEVGKAGALGATSLPQQASAGGKTESRLLLVQRAPLVSTRL